MADNKPQNVSDSDFEAKVLKAENVAVVDFWAPWCGPCLHMAPAIESFANNNTGKVDVFKMDVDENPDTAQKYGIRSIPTVIFFKGGEAVEMTVGAVPEKTLQEKLDSVIGG